MNLEGSKYPRTTAASTTVAEWPPLPKQAGPGSEPALVGPILMIRLSRSRILPPPRAKLCISTDGKPVMCPKYGNPIQVSDVWTGLPPRIKLASSEVPPTSINSAVGLDSILDKKCVAADGPSEGPDLTSWIGGVLSAGDTVPSEVLNHNEPVNPLESRERFSSSK